MGVYGPAIAGVNLVLLISSTVLIYLGNVLITFYLLPTLNFVDESFSAAPSLMLVVGTLGLFIGCLGVVVGATANRTGLIVHAILVSLVVIVQVASIFVTSELRTELQPHNSVLRRVIPDLAGVTNRYWDVNDDFKDSWDTLQRNYACCGFMKFNLGYQDWRKASGSINGLASHSYINKVNAVPDSCCHVEAPGCGNNQLTSITAHERVYTHGCLSVLQKRMTNDVEPVLTAYLGCGVALALLQILAVVLSASYAAALNRRSNREEDKYASVRGGEQQAMGSMYHFTDTAMPTLNRDSGLPGTPRAGSLAAGSKKPSLAGSMIPSLAGSKKSVYDDEDRSSQTRGEYRSSVYVEPTNEQGTVI